MTTINQIASLQKALERISGSGGADPTGLSGSVDHLKNIKDRLKLQSALATGLDSNKSDNKALEDYLPGDGRNYLSILQQERERLENLSKSFDQLSIPEDKVSELPVANKAENAWNSFVSSTKELINHNLTEARKLLTA